MKTSKKTSPVSVLYRAYQLLWSTIDIVYPPACAGCGKTGQRWCPECQSKVEIINQIVCPSCGEPQKSVRKCNRCLQNDPPYKALRSWAQFSGPVREALHHLKYKKDLGLGDALSKPLISLLNKLDWNIDLVVPVPLSSARLAERGYNQAALLAWPVAVYHHLEYESNALVKIQETKSQVGLSWQDRRTNVSGVFKADYRTVRGRRVLIIDDVTTTGATIESCSTALSFAGAGEVYGLTLARAVIGRSYDHIKTNQPGFGDSQV